MRSIFISICLLGANSVPAQKAEMVHYNLLLSQATVYAAKGELSSAFTAYDSAFAHVPWGLWQRTEACSLALEHGDTARALKYLEDTYHRGGQPLLTYSDPIKGLLKLGFQEPELGRLLRATHDWSENADSTWIKALIEMKELDQSVRSSNDPEMLLNDSINLERLITLCRERGFPSPAKVGSSFGIVSLLFWHHRMELLSSPRVQVFAHLALDAIARGEVQPDFLCEAEDFEDDQFGKPMRYGTLLFYFHDRGHIKLVERDQLNKNRASVGLAPIEDIAFQFGIDLNAVTQP